jgi:hypothetical protein
MVMMILPPPVVLKTAFWPRQHQTTRANARIIYKTLSGTSVRNPDHCIGGRRGAQHWPTIPDALTFVFGSDLNIAFDSLLSKRRKSFCLLLVTVLRYYPVRYVCPLGDLERSTAPHLLSCFFQLPQTGFLTIVLLLL